MTIRQANENDIAAIRSIYAPYVEQTAVSFEYEVPSLAEMERRFRHVTEQYPWLVAEDTEGNVVGYAYGCRFMQRAAYQWCAELAIYVDRNVRRSGVGSRLYEELISRLRRQGLVNLYACIAYTAEADEYLSNDSMHFHERMGFRKNAHFARCGKKFGRWYDMIWMEKE